MADPQQKLGLGSRVELERLIGIAGKNSDDRPRHIPALGCSSAYRDGVYDEKRARFLGLDIVDTSTGFVKQNAH